MKKLLMAIGLSLISGSLYAACFGPFCYDDTGASVAGLPVNGNGVGIPVVSSTTLNALTPYIGQEAICNTCSAANGSTNNYELCVATATAAKSFVIVSSTTKVCK